MFLSMNKGKRWLCCGMLAILGAGFATAQGGPDPCVAASAAESSKYDVQASASEAAIGAMLELVITPSPDQPISTVCFDSVPATGPDILKGANRTRVRIAIPVLDAPHGRKSLPAGTYPVRLLLAAPAPALQGLVLESSISVPLALTSVRPHPPGSGGEPFTVSLFGSGFDTWTPSNNVIMVNGRPRDVCWTDSECNARHSLLRGAAVSPDELEIAGLDPVEERDAQFRVRIGKLVTSPVKDDAAVPQWVAVIVASALLTLATIAIVLILVWTVRKQTLGGEDYILRLLFLDKETNTYSLSKLQFYLWTIAAVFGYIYLSLSKNFFQQAYGLPPIPAGLPGIVGISAGTAVAAQVVTTINGPKGAGQPKPSISDFVTTGEMVVAERVQFLVWTVIGVVGFVIFTARLDPRTFKDLPDIPATLLTISGISAFGYLGGKLARKPGPVITEAVMTTGPDPEDPQTAGPFGIIDLRGQTLSKDATFRVDDVDLPFAKLRGQKPQIVEPLSASKDETMAKRIRLVVVLDDQTRPLFVPGSEHTVSIANPDSQRAVFGVRTT